MEEQKRYKKIVAVIPCYNEEAAIADVIRCVPRERLRELGFSIEVLVVDNDSTDRTAAIARSLGARVIHEPKRGKGNAIRTAFHNISDDVEYVVMLDGDATYSASEMFRLIEPIDSGFCDVVVGSRLGGKVTKNAMKGFNRIGNWVFSFLVRVVYKANVTDTLTGYFAWRKDVVDRLRGHLRSDGFTIEMEMVTKMARLGYGMYSVPITYAPRRGDSHLRPLRDGVLILREFTRQLFWKPGLRRIAFVSDTIYPFNKGGKEKRLHEVTTRMARKGYEVHLYTMQWWEGGKTLVRDGVHLHAIMKRRPLYKEGRRSLTEAVLFSVACLKLVKEHFDVLDVDSIPLFPVFTTRLVCLLKRTRMFVTWHEVWGGAYWRTYMGRLGTLGAFCESLAIRLSPRIISNSHHTTEKLLRAGARTEIITAPLGIDLDVIANVPAHTLESDVVFAGRLIENKHVDVLIEAMAIVAKEVPEVRCVIVGDGPERATLEDMVKRYGLERTITFKGFLEDQRELYGLMKSSKLLVLPSTREGFGIIALEANACGLPVITTNHEDNAARDLIIEGENGFLTEADGVSLATQIKKAFAAKHLSPHKTLHETFGRYRWEHTASVVENTLTSPA